MRSLLKSLVDPSISCQIENLEISAGWFGYIRCDRYLRPQRYAISRRTLDPTLRAAAAFDAVSGRMRQYLALSILPTCNQREREREVFGTFPRPLDFFSPRARPSILSLFRKEKKSFKVLTINASFNRTFDVFHVYRRRKNVIGFLPNSLVGVRFKVVRHVDESIDRSSSMSPFSLRTFF